MRIHHATQKKADANNIAIVADLDAMRFYITDNNTGHSQSFVNASVGLAAILLDRTLKAEYPVLTLGMMADGKSIAVRYSNSGKDFVIGTWHNMVPTLADLVECCERLGVSPEDEPDFLEGELEDEPDFLEGELEDEDAPKDVVPDKYKALYAERGNRNHCGDWLALFLEGFSKDGTFNYSAFDDLLNANGVDKTGKWASLFMSGAKGWQGRYRMNGRQKLEQQIAETGKLVWGGENIKIPRAALATMKEKFKRSRGVL
jgi:hypothetical protein